MQILCREEVDKEKMETEKKVRNDVPPSKTFPERQLHEHKITPFKPAGINYKYITCFCVLAGCDSSSNLSSCYVIRDVMRTCHLSVLLIFKLLKCLTDISSACEHFSIIYS